MTAPAHNFTRLQKMAIFLIALGKEKAREILADVDLETVEKINRAIAELGPVSPEVKATVMIEFGDFFFKDKPLSGKFVGLGEKKVPPPKKTRSASTKTTATQKKQASLSTSSSSTAKDEEANILKTLQKLRQRVDPGKIDWSLAGYDFGEGFTGSEKGRH